MQAPRLLISVTLPNFNHGRFLREAIESVLMQTYPYLEILYVDDGSTDDSREIVEEIAGRDSRLKPVYFSQNQGVMKALDNAWRRVTGEVVYQFSSDDALSDPDFFRLGVEALTANPKAAGFYGFAQTVSTESGRSLGSMGCGLKQGLIEPIEFVRGFLSGRVFVPGISSLWRKKLMDDLGGYDPVLGPQADYFINHVLPALHGVCFCARSFARTRISELGGSYSSKASIDEVWSRLMLFERKARLVAPVFDLQEADWMTWRQSQLISLLSKTNPALAFLIRIKALLRKWMPEKLLFLMNIVERYVVGRVMRVVARLSPRYRDLTKRFL